MTRLVLFLSSVVLIIVVLSLRSFQDVKVTNNSFDYKEAKEKFTEVQEMIEKSNDQNHLLPEDEAHEVKVEAAKEIEIVLDTPELKNGAQVFRACVTCHGKNAEGKKGQKSPKLAGQYDWYLEKQITDIKNKERINAVMDPYVKKLSAQDIKDVSLYISKFPW